MPLDINMDIEEDGLFVPKRPQHPNSRDVVDTPPNSESFIEEPLPWLAPNQLVAPNDLPRAPGPLVFEGFVPQPFPSDFSFVHEYRGERPYAQDYHFSALVPQPQEVVQVPELPVPALHLPEETQIHQLPALAPRPPDATGSPQTAATPASSSGSAYHATGIDTQPVTDQSRTPEEGVHTSTRGAKERRPVGRPPKLKTYGKRPRGRPKGSGKRGGWSKGIKLGPRPTVEPSEEFNKLHQQAMDAFIDQQDPTKALELIIQAIEINPEIFSAHTLLCEIYLTQGEQQKAVSALWMGAHAFPRDPFVWQQCIDTCLQRTTYDRTIAWNQASYALQQLIKLDIGDLDVRFQYASSLAKVGRYQPCITQLTKYLLPKMPRNSSCLKLCGDCAQDLGRMDWALQNYEDAIEHYKKNGMKEDDAFEWMDVNSYSDLISKQKGDTHENIEEAIKVCKQLSRWLLGREQDAFWDDITEDDREFDAEDDPRRLLLDDFQPGRFEQETYGVGLPLEVRAQLGIFRLRLGGCREEALAHFEWLEPEENEEDSTVHQFPDIFLSVAIALSEAKEHQEALRFYEPLLSNKAFGDHSFYIGIGTSSYICGKKEQAMECFEAAHGLDSQSIEAKTYLSKLYAEQGDKEKAFEYADDAVQIARRAIPVTENRKYEKKNNRVVRQAAEAALKRANNMAGPQPARSRKKKRRAPIRDGDETLEAENLTPIKRLKAHSRRTINPNDGERIRQLYDTLVYNTEAMRHRAEPAKSIWMECARDLVNSFRDVVLFFPADPKDRFTGYDASRRRGQLKPSSTPAQPSATPFSVGTPSAVPSPSPWNADSPLPSIEPQFESQEPDPSTIPSDFHSIAFSSWLDIFLEYALILSSHPSLPPATRKESSYKLIRDTLRSSVFRHSHPFLLRIHTCWLAIALHLKDEQILFNTILRWFIKEYVFCTDAYRLLGAINLLFPHQQHNNTSSATQVFAHPNAQKFLWRHILTLDHHLPLSYISPNEDDAPVPEFMRRDRPELLSPVTVSPQEMDVVLLTVYGQMAYAGGSFVGALQYFFRARAIDPDNALVLLSISLCYFQEVCKTQGKQSGPRGGAMEVLQGWAVFQEYEDARIAWAERKEREGEKEGRDVGLVDVVRREVMFNRARVWMMLGMGDLAVRALEGLMEEEDGDRDVETMDVDGEAALEGSKVEWQKEVAYAMASTYATNGDAATAKNITERYLVVE